MISKLRSLSRRALLLSGMLLATSSIAVPANYQSVLVFGDSLSDTGNDLLASGAQGVVPAIPPSISPNATYWQGRFTNGPVAVEYLRGLIGRKGATEITPSVAVGSLSAQSGVSFAFGGSDSRLNTVTPLGVTVPGLLGQVKMFAGLLAGKKPSGNPLFVVWTGSNDYLQNTAGSPDQVVGNIVQSIRQLHALGGKNFLVPNLPDLGLTPFVKAQGLAEVYTRRTISHNALLADALTGLEREMPNARFVRLDVYALGASLVSTGQVNTDVPAAEFLAPGKGAADCLFRNPATCVDVPMPAFLPAFLFWDILHPTTQVHAVIGNAMYSALQQQR